MDVICLVSTIADIQVQLRVLGIAELRRAYVRQGDDLIPTGQVQWFIKDLARLKRLLVESCETRDRAISLGLEISQSPEELKIHRLLELADADELLAMADNLHQVEVSR